MKDKRIDQQPRGIALLVAIGTMIIILIIGSIALYVIIRGMNVTRGQARYETTYEAVIAALEIGKAKAESLNTYLDAPSKMTDTVRVGAYDAITVAERTSAQVITMS
ncbi:hypothetical protein KAS45_00690, partial [candidate division WOR-3 bacterium]|nr:hypothetical protein [candidate division WOR-3 bacterium]